MPLPIPQSDETKDEFIERFMGDETAVQDFPDEAQRRAVAEEQWEQAKANMKTLTITANASLAKKKTHAGREYLVLPGVLLREMVLHGVSGYENGPELAPWDEIAKTADLWEGTPVTLGHPDRTARNRETQEQYRIGTVWDVNPQPPKLHADIWIDIERAHNLDEGEALLQRAEAGEFIELSTGYSGQTEWSAGTHNGTPYNGIQRNIFPDHLAVFTQATGACSVEDGCGLNRLNAEGNIEEITMEPDEKFWTKLQNIIKNALTPGGTMSTERTREDTIAALKEHIDFSDDQWEATPCEVLNALYTEKVESDPKTNQADDDQQREEPQESTPKVNTDDVMNQVFADERMQRVLSYIESQESKQHERKQDLVHNIASKQAYNLEKDQLQSLPVDVLEAMNQNASTTDYSIRANAQQAQEWALPDPIFGAEAYRNQQKGENS